MVGELLCEEQGSEQVDGELIVAVGCMDCLEWLIIEDGRVVNEDMYGAQFGSVVKDELCGCFRIAEIGLDSDGGSAEVLNFVNECSSSCSGLIVVYGDCKISAGQSQSELTANSSSGSGDKCDGRLGDGGGLEDTRGAIFMMIHCSRPRYLRVWEPFVVDFV